MKGAEVIEVNPIQYKGFLEYVRQQHSRHPAEMHSRQIGMFITAVGTDLNDHYDFHGIFLNSEIVGVAVTLKSAPEHLNRIHIDADHRRKGYGEFFINSHHITGADFDASYDDLLEFFKGIGFIDNGNVSHCMMRRFDTLAKSA